MTPPGYAGNGQGRNNPSLQYLKDIGPLPQGTYLIGWAYDHPKLGPVTMDLIPSPSNQMFGRALFRIHGDSIAEPGTASDGCIVQARSIREMINGSDDRVLIVSA